jgi:hypothetical protein
MGMGWATGSHIRDSAAPPPLLDRSAAQMSPGGMGSALRARSAASSRPMMSVEPVSAALAGENAYERSGPLAEVREDPVRPVDISPRGEPPQPSVSVQQKAEARKASAWNTATCF